MGDAHPATPIMRNRIRLALAPVALVAVIAVALAAVVVDQAEQVYVTEFGRPVRLISEPGLHWKWPHQSRRGFDRRLQLDTPPPREMLTRDKKNLEVAWYVAWKIADVDRFLRSVRTIPDASARLEDMAASVLASELVRHDLTDLIRVGDASALDAMMTDASIRIADQAGREYGLAVVDVRLKRLNYPEEVRSAVFEQIRSERKRVAAATRAEGESQARTIRSAADLERARTLAEAEADAARLVGEGEAQAARIANDAHAADPGFYRFLKTLETYRTALDAKTTLVLSADSPFLNLLTQGIPAETPSAGGAVAGPVKPPAARSEQAGSRRERVAGHGGSAMNARRIGRCRRRGGFGRLPRHGPCTVIQQQDEVGVVRRFGAVLREPWPPGLHWALPRGIDRVDRVARDRERTTTVGARGPDAAPLSRSPDPVADDLFLTRATSNLVTAQARDPVPRVVRPVDYLFASRSADAAIEALGESALASALAGRTIDDVLTAGRAEVAERVRREVQAGADAQHLGISVRAVRLALVAPAGPGRAPAFADAARRRATAVGP